MLLSVRTFSLSLPSSSPGALSLSRFLTPCHCLWPLSSIGIIIHMNKAVVQLCLSTQFLAQMLPRFHHIYITFAFMWILALWKKKINANVTSTFNDRSTGSCICLRLDFYMSHGLVMHTIMRIGYIFFYCLQIRVTCISLA